MPQRKKERKAERGRGGRGRGGEGGGGGLFGARAIESRVRDSGEQGLRGRD